MKQEIIDHMRAFLSLMHELENAGYHSGTCGNDFSKCSIYKGEYPNSELAGYIDNKTLEITWVNK